MFSKLHKSSFSQQIFLAMFVIDVLATISFAVVTYSHSRKIVREYHKESLKKNEERIMTNFDYAIGYFEQEVGVINMAKALSPKMFELTETEKIDTRLYNLAGQLLVSTEPANLSVRISDSLMRKIMQFPDYHSVVISKEKENKITSFNKIKNQANETIGIIEMVYIQDENFLVKERNKQFITILFIYLALFILILIIAYFLSENIAKRISEIADRIKNTEITSDKKPSLITYERKDELTGIVNSYNKMIIRLSESTHALAKVEREEAWRKMARQVAHEIKNPLTPMRLSIQSFQRKYRTDETNEMKKGIEKLCGSLLQHIDQLSEIASAFSNFAKMPVRKDEIVDLVDITKNTIEIFDGEHVSLASNEEKILCEIDKIQYSRVITNLLTNAIEAVNKDQIPEIAIRITQNAEEVQIEVADNGCGISSDQQHKIFEPQFTTKTSGTGLGLAMVKKIILDYDGTIEVESEPGKGTVFYISLPVLVQ